MSNKGKVYVIDDDEAMLDSLNFLLESATSTSRCSKPPRIFSTLRGF